MRVDISSGGLGNKIDGRHATYRVTGVRVRWGMGTRECVCGFIGPLADRRDLGRKQPE